MRYFGLVRYFRSIYDPFIINDSDRFMLCTTHFKLADSYTVERWNGLKAHQDTEFIGKFNSIINESGKFIK